MSTPGWHPDPAGRYEYRWWNGEHWTGDVVQHGTPTVDPWPVEQVGQPVPGPGFAAPTAGPPTIPMAAPPTIPMNMPLAMPPGLPGAAAPPPPGGVHPVAPAGPPTSPDRRTLLVVGGVIAAAALAVGAFIVLGGDDEATVAPSTTIAVSTSVATTTMPQTSTTLPAGTTTLPATTVAPSTVPATTQPLDSIDALIAAMPASGEVPPDWSPYDDSVAAEAAPADGYCGGGNWAALAADNGALPGIHGPNWDLPDGGWFGLSAFTFPDEGAASAFIATIDTAANGCMTDPINYTVPESDMDLFVDGDGDDAVWNIAEVNGSFPGPSPVADEMTVVIYEEIITTNHDGIDYSLTRTEFQRFERHGRTVLVFWLFGEHDQTGFASAPDWAYTPDEAALDLASAAVRDLVVGRLAASGLV